MSLHKQIRISLTGNRHSLKNRQTSMMTRLSKELGLSQQCNDQRPLSFD
ncbi:MAG TPA: hypothetical protein V6C46_03275 [Coleofasciculaceae cyanobacterium]